MSDTENNVIVSHVSFEPKLTNISHKLAELDEQRRMSEADYDEGGTAGEKYSFPYTG